MNNTINNEFYSLAPSAWIYFFLRRAFHLLFLCLLLILFFHGDPHGVRINGHPPTDDQVVTLTKLGSIVGFVCLGLIGATCLYFWAFARSYIIELRPEGVSVKYGIINLRGETLLFPKVQDILIYRNLLERLLGLSTLMIQNAMGQPEILCGLSESTAEMLKEKILAHTVK